MSSDLKNNLEALRLDPSLTEALTNRAQAYLRKGAPDRAIADSSEAIRLDPMLASAYFLRHQAYAATGDTVRAEADRTRAIELDPKLKKAAPPSDQLPVPPDSKRP